MAVILDAWNLEDALDNNERPTETEAFARIKKARKLAWRIKRWGEVMLTERECEAMRLEMDAIYERAQAYKDAEQDANRHYKDMVEKARADDYAVYVARVNTGYYWAERELYHAQLVRRIERGIQWQIARRMGVSQQRVSQLLISASDVMEHFLNNGVAAGWKEELRGRKRRFTLTAKVAVTAKSGQVVVGNFEPQPLERAA